jgi:acetolactate synthase-1/2/3 large subunit
MGGMHGEAATNHAVKECDVLIAIGMRFDDRVTGRLDSYARQAKVVHFDIDPAEIDKNVKAEVAVIGDAKDSLRRILPLLKPSSHEEWLQRFRDCDRLEHEKVVQEELHPTSDVLTMGEVIRILNEKTSGDAVIVTDVGQHQMVACRYAKFVRSKSNITSGGLGTMGFGLPAAMGAALAAPDRTVVAVIGDGGLQMTIQELATIYQTGAKVKVLLLNNEFLGMVRQWQELFFERRYSSTEMVNPDFQLLAQGFRLPTARVTCREELEPAIEAFVKDDGASFLEVLVGRENNVFPMVPSGCGVAEIRLE